jgi:hypothetical protein
MTTKDNQKLHLYYKHLFGKPSHCKQEEMLLHDQTQPANLFGSTMTPSHFSSTTKGMRRAVSQEQMMETFTKEKKWVGNFSIMGSKNNDRVHRHFQEYFDRPVGYDNQGYRPVKKKYGDIYNKLSPLRMSKYNKKLRHQSMSSMKSNHGMSSCGAPNEHDSVPNDVQDSPQKEGEGDKQDHNKQNHQKLNPDEDSPNLQQRIVRHRKSRRKKRNSRRSLTKMENDPSNKYAVLSMKAHKASPVVKKRELAWKKVGDPISTYNELVHKTYRVGFDRL